MTLTEEDITRLLPRLRTTARAVGKHFPRWRLNEEDLVQIGWLHILLLPTRESESEDNRTRRCLNRAYVRMIDAMRAFQGARPQSVRKMEVLWDVVRLADQQQAAAYREEQPLRALDLKRFVAGLSPHEQQVFWGRYQALYHREIAAQIGRTEGRACQIEKAIVKKLREAA